MKRLGRNQFRISWMCVFCMLLLTTMFGCKPKEDADKKKSDNTKVTKSESSVEPANVVRSSAETLEAESKDKLMRERKAVTPQQTEVAARSVQETPELESPAIDDREAQRQEKEDLIYALIRVKMEEYIQERKDLLAAGTPPYDEKVRKLEDSIMRARGFLLDHGEEVDDVEPPIVQKQNPS